MEEGTRHVHGDSCCCKSGARGALAAARLQELDFTNVSSMGRESSGWIEAGYLVERQPLLKSTRDRRFRNTGKNMRALA